ncbi:hypothetical protein [Burkholderia sp. Tr-862]|uniref:hypothetical protein n=1 Tax=Burkholderia sp. Tr-862 TaxID=2608331 RepID=UPI001FFD4F10|nr:hypothetical protein [Burkholderia sp. Tr-862]
MPGDNAHALSAHAVATIAMRDSHGARRMPAVCDRGVPSVDSGCVVIDIVPFQNCAVTRRTRRIPALRLAARLAWRCRASLFTARHSVRFVMNCSASLSSLVCIVSACVACAAGAQTVPATPADAPDFASSTPLAPVPLQRSAQTAITGAATKPATAASDVAAPAAALPAASTAAAPESRARGALRRPLVPTRPHRSPVADVPTEDLWHTGTLYTSPYAKSPYAQPGDPD